MTTLGSRDLAPAPAPLQSPGSPHQLLPRGATLVLRWPILPAALRAAPALAALAPKSAIAPASIEWSITPDRALAFVAYGMTRVPIPRYAVPARWEFHPDAALWSLDAALDARTLLSATIAPRETPRALYAATSIFSDFNIPGGRYGPVLASVVTP